MAMGRVAGSASKPEPNLHRNVPTSLFGHVKWEHLAAGVSGGVISTVALHPLDLVKVRFQVNEGVALSAGKRPQYQGIFHALVTIGRQEGIRGLYQGATPNIWGAGLSWGLYFLFYNSLKAYTLEKKGTTTLDAGAHMLAAAEAGVCTLVITNPVWVAKTRLCLQYDSVSNKGAQYKGMADCLWKVYKFEGMRGLYKGFVPGMFGVSHGALQFMAYEELKKLYNKRKNLPLDTKFSSAEYLAFAAISKMFAAGATYPYQVLRARLQDQHRHYSGLMDITKQIWRLEGAKGFYKGLMTNLLRVTPACCITFVVYENMVAYLMSPAPGKDKKSDSTSVKEEKNYRGYRACPIFEFHEILS